MCANNLWCEFSPKFSVTITLVGLPEIGHILDFKCNLKNG